MERRLMKAECCRGLPTSPVEESRVTFAALEAPLCSAVSRYLKRPLVWDVGHWPFPVVKIYGQSVNTLELVKLSRSSPIFIFSQTDTKLT